MSQLNVNLTPDFEAKLRRLMRLRGLRSKSETVRIAVAEALEHATAPRQTTDFESWLGLGASAPRNPRPKFRRDNDLWK